MQTVHERSVDKRRTLIQAKSKSTLSRFVEDFLIFLRRPLGSIHVLEDTTGEGYQELTPPVCQKRSSRPDLDVCKPISAVVLRVRSSGLSSACSAATTAFKTALRSYEESGDGVGRGIGD